MSFAGPRPHFSPLDTSSSSITPFDPRFTVTIPSKSCAAKGMNTPTHFLSAASTSGRLTSCGMCGEPISSSPSATITRFTGTFLPAPRIACSAARNAAAGHFGFTAPRPTITFHSGGRCVFGFILVRGFSTVFWLTGGSLLGGILGVLDGFARHVRHAGHDRSLRVAGETCPCR